jgi:hypothetical protein
MAHIIIEGDPWQLRELLDELYDRYYLPSELNVKFLGDDDNLPVMKLSAELDAVKMLEAIVNAINDEDRPAFREPILGADELKLLECAEALIAED